MRLLLANYFKFQAFNGHKSLNIIIVFVHSNYIKALLYCIPLKLNSIPAGLVPFTEHTSNQFVTMASSYMCSPPTERGGALRPDVSGRQHPQAD